MEKRVILLVKLKKKKWTFLTNDSMPYKSDFGKDKAPRI